jgi:hypothetical protein
LFLQILISTMNEINSEIEKQICYNTINNLKDENLIDVYRKCNSVIIAEQDYVQNLRNCEIDEEKIQKALKNYSFKLIPTGTKGSIRGNLFNKIVEFHIMQMKLDINDFEVEFEKKCDSCLTTEIPDFTIKEKSSGKVIIGMNQLDLWNGGQQINRGSKYLIDNKHNTETSKLLCVVCNHKDFKCTNNKAFSLFVEGFKNNTLCYLNGLSVVINKFFGLSLGDEVIKEYFDLEKYIKAFKEEVIKPDKPIKKEKVKVVNNNIR